MNKIIFLILTFLSVVSARHLRGGNESKIEKKEFFIKKHCSHNAGHSITILFNHFYNIYYNDTTCINEFNREAKTTCSLL